VSGRSDEAVDEIKRAQLLDPLSIGVNVNVGRIYLFTHRYDQAVEELRKAGEMEPNFRAAHMFLGQALAAKGLI